MNGHHLLERHSSWRPGVRVRMLDVTPRPHVLDVLAREALGEEERLPPHAEVVSARVGEARAVLSSVGR
jgi:hypothetical protein